jgi:iron complex outermembrane receptor protein
MNTRFLSTGLLAGLCLSAAIATAQEKDEHHTLDEIIVSATPLARTVEELAQPTSVLAGDALVREQSASIGETLADQPGISASYFGPVASRPIIRGQFGERVRVLSNGLDSLDASALSEDHAVGLDSILAERVEIVRGPATLLYGSGAAGGLVNIVDSRLRNKPLENIASGALSIGSASATGRKSIAAKLDLGNELLAAHVDVFSRSTNDLEVPGDPGVIPNTDSSTDGGAGSASLFGDNGFLSAAVSRYRSNYGIPGDDPDEVVRIALDQTRVDLNGEYRFSGPIEKISIRFADNDYGHTELEGDEIGTVFDSQGTDTRIEVKHSARGGLDGAIGLQYKHIDFSAIGDEAFVPASQTEQIAIYAFEEYLLSDSWVLQGSARIEQQNLDAMLLPSYDDTAFGASIGGIWTASEPLTLALNLSVTERHPNSTELYADGPHIAVQRFERGSIIQGNGILNKELSTNLDLTMRLQLLRSEINLTLFHNNVDDYILLRPTAEIQDDFQVYDYVNADVEIRGFELEALFDIFENDAGHLHARFSSDVVHAEESSGAYLPRLPPLRLGLGLHYTHGLFEASIEAVRTDSQDKVAANELPSSAYTLLGAEISTRLADEKLLIFLKGSNLGDELARRHTSPLKEILPLPGRSIHFGLRWDF